MNEVCLLRPDKGGDAIKTLPVLRALMAKKTDLKFHLLVSEHNGSVFELEPGLTLHVLPKNWKKMKAERLSTIFGNTQFSCAINLLCDPSEGMETILSSLPTESRFSIPLPGAKLSCHALHLPSDTPAGRDESENIAILLSQVFQIDLTNEFRRFLRAPIFSPSDELEALEKMGPKHGIWLGLCPFAGSARRQHPLRRWQKLIQKITLQNDFEKLFLFGTPSDYSTLDQLREGSPRKEEVELCFPSSFRTLGAYLKRLDGVIAVDSGPLHLAQSLGIKSLGLLSGGDADRWFAHPASGDYILRRGIFNRFPSIYEMLWAYQKWSPAIFESNEPIKNRREVTASLPA